MFLNFVLICVTLILSYIFEPYFESLFTNFVFECLIYFVRTIIEWPGDRPIFQEEDEDMVDPVDYFIWRRLSSSTMTIKETELLRHDLQKFVK